MTPKIDIIDNLPIELEDDLNGGAYLATWALAQATGNASVMKVARNAEKSYARKSKNVEPVDITALQNRTDVIVLIGVLRKLVDADGEAEAIDFVASWMDGMFEWVADNSTNGPKERRELHIWEKTMGALNDIYCAMVGQKTRT